VSDIAVAMIFFTESLHKPVAVYRPLSDSAMHLVQLVALARVDLQGAQKVSCHRGIKC